MTTATDFTPDELALTREILQQAYQDLREQIYKAENTDFRAQLKRREDALAAIIKKFAA